MTIQFDVARFRKMFPQFADDQAYPDEILEMYWDLAICFISDEEGATCLSDDCHEKALYYVTAHIVTISTRAEGGGTTGLVTSATVGRVSATVAEYPAGSDSWKYFMGQTPYGQIVVALFKKCSVGGFYVGGNPERSAIRRVGGDFGAPWPF